MTGNMKRLAFFAVALTAAFIGINAETYRINVGEFNELVVNDHVNVIYASVPDSAGYVVFDAKPEFASYVMAERNKGKLKIQLDGSVTNYTGPQPTVYAYSSFLSKASNSQDSTLCLRQVSPGAKIEVELQGNGKIIARNLNAVDVSLKLITGKGTIIASGKCDNLNVKNVGTGVIQADEVIAKDVKCQLMGTGTIGCSPQKSLSVRGLGSGKVYYAGTPHVSVNKLSTVKTIPLDSEAGAPELVEEEPVATEDETEEVEPQPEPSGLLDLIDNPAPASSDPDRDPEYGRPSLRSAEPDGEI